MSIAAATRNAVDREPFLRLAIRAGVVNYSAAARYLDVGDPDAVAAALRRLAEELPPVERTDPACRIRVRRGARIVEHEDDAVLRVGEMGVAVDDGELAVLIVVGELTAAIVGSMLYSLAATDIDVPAAGWAGEQLVIACPSNDAVAALRTIEEVRAPGRRHSTD